MPASHPAERGFTLIELSIVLVIIGLIVGGVLVGQSLVSAAAARAQISQIEKYQTAANTFRGKYGYLPGDIKDPDASNFGFQARGTVAGTGDGNYLLEGNWNDTAGNNNGVSSIAGETAVFWVDLSTAHMIDGTFTKASETNENAWSGDVGGCCNKLSDLLPIAKVNGNDSIYVWSNWNTNYFGLSEVSSVGYNGGAIYSNNTSPGVTVAQAYAIDKKMDDGLPATGNVQAQFVSSGTFWAPWSWAGGAANMQGKFSNSAPAVVASPAQSS